MVGSQDRSRSAISSRASGCGRCSLIRQRRQLPANRRRSRPRSPTPLLPIRSVPLIDSPEAKVRELHNIGEKLILDVASMNPAAAAYVRRHPCHSPEWMKKWRRGYLPNDGGGDKRGWSLRGNIVYPVVSEHGKVLAWVGRDVHYEEKG
jgi:hypothetical protein